MEASAKHLEETFLATFEPATIQQAEAHLQQLAEQPGFVSVMMYLLGHPNANPYIQQAGATYFKNFLYRFWEKRSKDTEKYFSIPEEEKQVVRANIVDLVCQAPPKIKSILSVGYGRIVSYDFPEKMCEDTVRNIGVHLQSSDTNAVVGALLCFYEIAKKYEFKNAERGRAVYAQLIPMTFPYLLNMAKITAPMDTVEKAIIFKLILKIFYVTIHYELDEVLYKDAQFSEWLSLCVSTMSSPVPELQDLMGKNPAFQAQKWAATTLYQLFHRYGIPKLASDEHKQFAENFQQMYARNITEVALGVLLRTEHAKLTGRVAKVCINILEAAVNASKTWAIVKQNLNAVVSQVIFPVLCHSEADQELWEDDQQEYIKEKLDPIAEFQSSEKAAQVLLMEMTAKRKDVLMPILGFCNNMLTTYNNTPPEQRDPRQKDGVLHIIGTLATLIEKKLSGSLEQLLVTHIFPEFQSPHGFMRFRCCWILQQFNDVEYSNDDIVVAATDFVLACLRDPDLPVRVMGAVAIQHVTRYEAAMARMQPHLLAVMQELIELTNQAEVDDLADVMQELVTRYGHDLGSVAIQIAAQLTQTFTRMIVESADAESEEDINKAMVAMGILRTLSTIIAIFVDKPEILSGVEASVLPAIDCIFSNNQIDFIEDVLDVMVTVSFVRKAISEQMWAYFPVLYQLFSTECFDYFDEMMPMFDNYISFGTERFLADPAYMTATMDMVKRILTNEDAGETSHIKACQLVESVVLHCRGRVTAYMPALLETLFVRLNTEIKTRDLELMLLEVLAECIFYDAGLALHTMEAMQAGSVQTTKFFELWFRNLSKLKRAHDLHVTICAVCEILSLPEQQLPPPVAQGVSHMVAALLGAFAQLPEAYKRKQQMKEYLEAEENDEVEDVEYESYPDTLELGDDDDYEDQEGDEYLQELARRAGEANPSDDEYEDDDEDEDDEGLDEEDVVVETAIDTMDMYIVTRDTFKGGRGRTPESFAQLVASLPPEHQQQLMHVFETAAQREATQPPALTN